MREADVHVPAETIRALGFEEPSADLGGAKMRDITMLSCNGPACLVVTTMSEDVDDALDDTDYVEWWERLDTDDGGVTYLQKVVAPALPEDAPSPQEQGVVIQDVSPDERGCTMTIVGEQEALQNYGPLTDELPVSLKRLSDYAGPPDELDVLTGRQREVLETAHELGYYEVPREVTADEIAAELDLDRSTVTEHLQRAEGNLLSAILSD